MFFIIGAPLGPKGLLDMKDPASAQQGRCIRASVVSCGTVCSRLTLSSRIPPCRPTQLPAPSFSWRRFAGDSRRRRWSPEHCSLSKGKRTDMTHVHLFSSSVFPKNIIFCHICTLLCRTCDNCSPLQLWELSHCWLSADRNLIYIVKYKEI